MGLFSKTQKTEFTPWPSPKGKDSVLYGLELHEMKVVEDPNYSHVIVMLELAAGTHHVLGRVVLHGKNIAIESWGQWIGYVEPRQAAYWRGKLAANGGWAWCEVFLGRSYGQPIIRRIRVDKTKLT